MDAASNDASDANDATHSESGIRVLKFAQSTDGADVQTAQLYVNLNDLIDVLRHNVHVAQANDDEVRAHVLTEIVMALEFGSIQGHEDIDWSQATAFDFSQPEQLEAARVSQLEPVTGQQLDLVLFALITTLRSFMHEESDVNLTVAVRELLRRHGYEFARRRGAS